MQLDAFDYTLPPGRVAQEPAARRDAARLMVLDRARHAPEETVFAAIGDHLGPGDLLVLNDTRVVPARLLAAKPSGGRTEILLLDRTGEGDGAADWRCMVSPVRGLRPGLRLAIGPGFEAEVLVLPQDGRTLVRLRSENGAPEAAIQRHGRLPLPPYIHREPGDGRESLDRERYQTVYARREGAVAAPTAGLHFTRDLLESLRARGIDLAHLTLHVGPGTFQPVRAERIEEHRIEPERYRLPEESAAAVDACRARGGRVVAVGTTVMRVLEGCAREGGRVRPGAGWCDLYITPGLRFQVVDALVTNFHLPRSSLLILVAAFAGRERVLDTYRIAVDRQFRFYSYGDAMLIL
ncbi:MAG: tRNA preQ1(34) S-adenosylmethionine ribosyltransferase-isomerase QueA [Acidobacteria bacterium]|nr:MAG: tRNA preQ1(34) S-adenosylmethionine ribosyltransferase-isomerase QueA [Acidobacteriota bacterium]